MLFCASVVFWGVVIYIYYAVDYSTHETPRLMCDFEVGTVLYLEHIPLLAQL